jgi:hypothetical protein
MQQITKDVLRQLIQILPNLRRLVLLHTISDVDILSLLSKSPELFYHIDSLIHFAFFRHFGQATFPAVFSHIRLSENQSQVSITSLPYFTPGQLVQALTDFLSFLGAGRTYDNLTSCMSHEAPLLATYASAVREPGRSWSERIVPFIPISSDSSSALSEHEGWFFAWSMPFRRLVPNHYAFAKVNKEVKEECQRRIDELLTSLSSKPQNCEDQNAGVSDAKLDDNSGAMMFMSDEELLAKENDIKSGYADRMYCIFNVKSFFQELIKEGRPAPSPEALTKLLELFAALGEKKDISLCVMTPADLTSFMEKICDVQARCEWGFDM